MELSLDISRFQTKKGKPNSHRAYWIQELADLIGCPFKSVLVRTFNFTENELQEIYDKAKAWKVNSPALANKLIKEKNLEIKKSLK